MKVIEYIGEILPDGHLSIPDQEELESYKSSSLKVTISFDSIDAQKGWEIFRQMGRNAKHGKLPNAAEDHDKYLYGKAKWKHLKLMGKKYIGEMSLIFSRMR